MGDNTRSNGYSDQPFVFASFELQFSTLYKVIVCHYCCCSFSTLFLTNCFVIYQYTSRVNVVISTVYQFCLRRRCTQRPTTFTAVRFRRSFSNTPKINRITCGMIYAAEWPWPCSILLSAWRRSGGSCHLWQEIYMMSGIQDILWVLQPFPHCQHYVKDWNGVSDEAPWSDSAPIACTFSGILGHLPPIS